MKKCLRFLPITKMLFQWCAFTKSFGRFCKDAVFAGRPAYLFWILWMRIDTDKIHSREKFELSWVNYLFSQNILKVTCLYMYAMNLLFIVSLIYNNIYREKYVCLSVRPSMVSASLFQSQSLSPSCITYRQNKQRLSSFAALSQKMWHKIKKLVKIQTISLLFWMEFWGLTLIGLYWDFDPSQKWDEILQQKQGQFWIPMGR